MPTLEARIKKLEKKVAKLEKENKIVVKWIGAECKWSRQVTKMLHQINWAKLADAFPGVALGNPPQQPPKWPPPK